MSALAVLEQPQNADKLSAFLPRAVRLYEIKGDCCEPALRSRDMLMVAAVDHYEYETTYLLDFGHGESPYLCQLWPGRLVTIRRPNPHYTTERISLDEFNAAVRAMVVAEVKMRDQQFLRHLTRAH